MKRAGAFILIELSPGHLFCAIKFTQSAAVKFDLTRQAMTHISASSGFSPTVPEFGKAARWFI